MFEEESAQNGTQSNDQSSSPAPYGFRFRPSALDDSAMADQISSGNMFATPQASGQGDGAFLNRSALQIDPQTGNAYRKFGLPAASTGTSGQTTAGQSPTSLPPIQPRDDQGKTLPKYRMGIGQRILGTVANFANGFARNGASPIYVGPGALNNRYYQDEELRQQQNRQKPPNAAPAPASGTQPGSDGSETMPGISPTTFNARPPVRQMPARVRFAQFQAGKAPNGRTFRHTAVNPQTGQRIGSNDGQSWEPLDGSGGTRA